MHLGKNAQALDGARGDGGCREVTLQASRTASGGGHHEDERAVARDELRGAVGDRARGPGNPFEPGDPPEIWR